MEIQHRAENGVYVLELSGRLDELATGEAETAFQRVLDNGHRQVLVDMSGVEYISSSGLRVLLMLSRGMKRAEGTLKLSGLSPFVAEVFEVSNFTALFDVYPDRDQAAGAFAR